MLISFYALLNLKTSEITVIKRILQKVNEHSDIIGT